MIGTMQLPSFLTDFINSLLVYNISFRIRFILTSGIQLHEAVAIRLVRSVEKVSSPGFVLGVNCQLITLILRI